MTLLQEFAATAPAYVPLGVVGAWRWGVWLTKKIMARLYRPTLGGYHAKVSVVTPVYNEDPDVFWEALRSWRRAGVDEIVAVVDHTDTRCIELVRAFAGFWPAARLIVTQTPGKRSALADGIRAATGDIVALVDSDTVWADDVMRKCLSPFRDLAVGGVTMRQIVREPRTVAQRIYAIQQTLRFLEEYPFLTALDGSTVHCLSGRTAFYRRSAVLPLLRDLVHETFWGREVISGDDKRLTYLLEEHGWKVAYQQHAHVYMYGEPNMKTFLKQRLRWTRNSWRADLRALTKPWVWRKPYFALYLLDRAVQPFTLMLGPIYFIASLVLGLWVPAATLLVWWHVSRAIRLWPHMRRHPRDILLVPFYVLFNYYSGLVKIHALFSLNRQGWMTRWDSSRLPQFRWLRLMPSYAATVAMLLVLIGIVFSYKHDVLQYPVAATLADGTAISVRQSAPAHDDLRVDYIPGRNAIIVQSVQSTGVSGAAGHAVTLADIRSHLIDAPLREFAPGVWYLGSDLVLSGGLVLDVSGSRLRELKLGDTPRGRARVVQVPG